MSKVHWYDRRVAFGYFGVRQGACHVKSRPYRCLVASHDWTDVTCKYCLKIYREQYERRGTWVVTEVTTTEV